MLVFVPLSVEELSAWAGGAGGPGSGFAATGAFLEAFGLADPDDPHADLTLLEIAGLAALLRVGARRVAVAQARATRPGEPAEFGAVACGEVPWRAVTSLFADDASGALAADATRAALGEVSLAEAWDDPRVADLLARTELLWHDATEWRQFVAPGAR